MHLEPNEVGRELGKSLAESLRPAVLDHDGPALDPTELAQTLHGRSVPMAMARWRTGDEQSNDRLRCLLRPHHQWPRNVRCRRAAEQRDELAPVAVGTPIAGGPPRRSVLAAFPHTAPTSGVRRQIACRARDEGCAVLEASRQSAASSVPS